MTRAAAARSLARAAAVGSGGLGVLGGSLFALLRLEAKVARWRIGGATLETPDPSGRYGEYPGTPIRLAVVGDSAAAGYGASIAEETFGSYLAHGLAALTSRPVDLVARAVVGARSADLTAQLTDVLADEAVGTVDAGPAPGGGPPDVVAAIIGANDVTHAVRPAASVAALRAAVAQIRANDVAAVVGTCPDLGTVRPIAPPLRQVARRWSRRLAAAQTIAVVESGGRSVSLGSLLGPDFDREPGLLFGPDRFHPSPAGYRALALAMLPSVADAIGLLPDDGHEPDAFRGHAVYGLGRAAAVAAEHSGTEVAAATGLATAGAVGAAPGRSGTRTTAVRPLLARVLLRRHVDVTADMPGNSTGEITGTGDIGGDVVAKRAERVVSTSSIGQARPTSESSTRR
jgi:lysophospholipase L1-like esterase